MKYGLRVEILLNASLHRAFLKTAEVEEIYEGRLKGLLRGF